MGYMYDSDTIQVVWDDHGTLKIRTKKGEVLRLEGLNLGRVLMDTAHTVHKGEHQPHFAIKILPCPDPVEVKKREEKP